MDTSRASRVLLFAVLAVVTQALSVDEITERQSQITIDTFQYFQDQIGIQQTELETQIEHLESRVAELEAAAEVGCDCQGSPGTGTGGGDGTAPEGTRPEETGPEETVPEETGPEETVPEETVPEEIVPTEKLPTIAPTTAMKPTTTIPTIAPRPPTTGPAPAAVEYQRTCAEIYESGYTTSGEYTIDPDGAGTVSQFVVHCDMESGQGVTIVGHDSEDDIVVDGFEEPGSFVLVPTYTNSVSMVQLGALADASTKCLQHIKYVCRNAGLMEIDPASGMTYAWWTDRNGQKRVNWAGAPTDSEKCECGEKGTCYLGSLTCNCDHKKSKNQKDEGDFSDKELLPVLSIHLGDTGSKKERAAVNLGRFECRG